MIAFHVVSRPVLRRCALAAGGCLLAWGSAAAGEARPAPAAPSRPSAEQAQYHVMAGEMAAGREQPRVAADEFLKALELIPDKALAGRATALALRANDEQLALTAARRWLEIEGTSLEAREVITRLSLRAGLDEETYAQCAAIVRDHPGGVDDGFRHAALLLAQEPEHIDAALAIMARLVEQYPKQAGAWQAQSLLALRFNRLDLAEKSAREALKLAPNGKDSALLLTGALVKKGAIAEADQMMDAVLKNNPSATDLRMGYVRLLIEADQRQPAREQLKRILATDPEDDDAHYALALLELDERHFDEAEPHLERLARTGAKAGEHAMQAEYYLGRIAEVRNQPQAAYDHYEKVVSGDQALDATLRRALLLGKLGRLDEARQTLTGLRRQFPPLRDRVLAAEGDMLSQAGAYDEAVALFTAALAETPNNADLRYARSLVYDRGGRPQLAEADLQTVLDKHPDDARALNALGYMLIVHTTRYTDAEKLISRALELGPEEPATIDSMGWLRFRQGRNPEALELLQKAYSLMPDAEIAAHLGEVLWVSGDRDKARSIWAEGGKTDPDNIALRETVRRLTQ